LEAEAGPPRDRRAATRELGLASEAGGEVLFRVHAACDQRCLFCCADPATEPLVCEPAALAAAVATLPDPQSAPVVLSGGEPTLAPDLPDRVAAVLGAGAAHVMIQTNGMSLTEPALLDGLHPFRERLWFLVSLHSHRADVSDVITRTRGGHTRTLAGIEAALATGYRVWVNHVLTTLSHFELETFVRFVRERFPELSLLVLSTVNPRFRAAQNAWLMAPFDALGRHLRRGLAVAREVGLAVSVSEACGVPLCVVRGFEEAHDASAPGPDGRPAGEARLPVALPPDRRKAPQCAGCRHDARCLGLWSGYVARFGFAGITPVPPIGGDPGAPPTAPPPGGEEDR
jgi:pyruvate-formate lyase-activating enzyme